MDVSELSRNIQAIWEQKPTVVVLLVLACVGFLYLVLDTWRHRREFKRRRR